MAVTAIVGAVVGVVSATSAIVKTVQGKRQADRAIRFAKIRSQEDEARARRQGAYTRLAQSRISIIQAQAAQAEVLAEGRKARQRMTYITLGGSLLVLTIIAWRRK